MVIWGEVREADGVCEGGGKGGGRRGPKGAGFEMSLHHYTASPRECRGEGDVRATPNVHMMGARQSAGPDQ